MRRSSALRTIRAHTPSPPRRSASRAATEILLQAQGIPAVVSRAAPKTTADNLLVLTPEMTTPAAKLAPFALQGRKLIVLPKWLFMPRPLRPGFVDKLGVLETSEGATALLNAYAKQTKLGRRKGVTRFQCFLRARARRSDPMWSCRWARSTGCRC